jgi:hypothetical protein
MSTRLTLVAALFLALSMSPGLTRVSLTAVPLAQQTPSAGAGSPAPGMQDMMKMHEQMMADMKAGNAKLDALIKEMNSATGELKVNAIAAVVNELVRQHKSMHGRMGQMHEHMMGGRGMMMKR